MGIGQNDQLTFVVGDEVLQARSAALHQLWGFEGVAGAEQVHLQGRQSVMACRQDWAWMSEGSSQKGARPLGRFKMHQCFAQEHLSCCTRCS